MLSVTKKKTSNIDVIVECEKQNGYTYQIEIWLYLPLIQNQYKTTHSQLNVIHVNDGFWKMNASIYSFNW